MWGEKTRLATDVFHVGLYEWQVPDLSSEVGGAGKRYTPQAIRALAPGANPKWVAEPLPHRREQPVGLNPPQGSGPACGFQNQNAHRRSHAAG